MIKLTKLSLAVKWIDIDKSFRVCILNEFAVLAMYFYHMVSSDIANDLLIILGFATTS